MARFSVGQMNEPPSAEGSARRVAAMVHSARASAALERRDAQAAVDGLRAAVGAGQCPEPDSRRILATHVGSDTVRCR